ncbi:MAG: acetate--CoA ligase [Candidatus Nealsonbacteria bacterium RIFCSPLOWO2_01_FULL_41_9]|uniref:Acetate--CoA ligase n=1 Tax=Candidatus Nealsonbacteria bacterium RIFCSPLOWO2_01_FULL_41_9 TaxID=1801671 RepID=A0A1G2ECT9_9BACT|nr:MAG: acetate--CoA ligase [Candidatus Nealsonbacteria bacterium RIFCSPLOWO2_01_FULL_41_9]
MEKKGDLYYPSEEYRKKAIMNDAKIYEKAAKDPIKFWEDLAKELVWHKKWERVFEHEPNPPYFQWFLGGKINITDNIFKKTDDSIALIWEPEPADEKPIKLTYRELFLEVCKFANALKKRGVEKGDRVGIYLPMIPEVVIAMLACARIGAVHTVVFSAFSPVALKARLEDTEAKILITADGYFRRGQIVNLKQNADQGVEGTKVEKVIVVKRAGNEIPWQENRDVWWQDLPKDESWHCQAEIMDSEDPLFILYTSGSTGKPKGVLHTCGGYAVQALWTGKWIFNLKPGNVFWCTSDPGWVTGHTYTIYSPLLNGATTLMFEGAPDWPDPDRWAQIIEKHKVNTFYTAPTAIRLFEKYGADILKKYKFESLELLGSVGEPIDEGAWNWYFKEVGKERCPIVDTWWQTETGGILISSLPGIGPFKPSFAGLPFPGVNVDIRDGNLVILPPFAPGMLRGIYKNPDKYKETYWSQYPSTSSGQAAAYFTSDGAIKDENGLIRIIGRVDDVIKVAGHRISTGELENAVNMHPEINECAVIGVPDDIKGEVPVIFAVSFRSSLNEDGAMLKQGIIDQIKKEIGPIALPKEVYLVEDLPKTRSGKIMRRILRKLFTGEELGDLSTLSNPESVEKIKQIL